MASNRWKSLLHGITQQKLRSACDKYLFLCEELTFRLQEKGHTVSEAGLIAMCDTIYSSLLKEQELTLEDIQEAKNERGGGHKVTRYIRPEFQIDDSAGAPCIMCGTPLIKSRTSDRGYCRCWPVENRKKKGER